MEEILRSRRPVRLSVPVGVACYVVMGMLTLLLSLVLSLWVHPILDAYGLGWISHAGAAGFGGVVMFIVISTMLKGQTALALDSNLAVIETSLRHLIRTNKKFENSI